jgi:hypothetical protein
VLGWIAPELTLGIFALERPWNFFFASFFITLAGCVALLTARLVCAYGKERFDIPPPDAFVVGEDMRWRTFLLAQLPGLVLLGYIGYISIKEAHELDILTDTVVTFVGIAAALAIWSAISIVYYWAHQSPLEHPTQSSGTKVSLGARAFFLPHLLSRRFARRIYFSPPPPFAKLLNNHFLTIAALYGPGYRDPSRPAQPVTGRFASWLIPKLPCHSPKLPGHPVQNYPLHSGYALNLTLAILLVGVYCAVFPLTAPVPIPFGTKLVSVLFGLTALSWFGAFCWHYANADERERSQYTWIVWFAGSLPGVFLFYAPLGYFILHRGNWEGIIPAFPSIAPIVMLLIIVFWICSALAFLLDRFRIPVLSTAVVLILLANLIVYGGGWIHNNLRAAEHPGLQLPIRALLFLIPNTKENLFDFACTAGCTEKQGEPPLPAEILDSLSSVANPRPLIVITATGGGIHAGVWTAEVLAELERAFFKQKQDFHGSILLLSTVSGGSVGAVPFLRSYFEKDGFDEVQGSTWLDTKPDPGASSQQIHEWEATVPRAVSSVAASSLEAVSWGIVYPEVFRLLFPARSLFGANMEEYDRGWAMQQRMAANMGVDDCPAVPEGLRNYPPLAERPIPGSIHAPRQCLTLRDLAEAARTRGGIHVPAVSFNTTTAENGSRFLLANYRTINTPRNIGIEVAPEILPAESFLHVYGSNPFEVPGWSGSSVLRNHIYYPDLELLSAARLSATFPYVSPMARVPRVRIPGTQDEVFAKPLHFADGGYFDNDGIGTAIEFLYEAFKERKENDRNERPKKRQPLPILFIEIRDSEFAENSPDSCSSQIVSGKCADTPNFSPKDKNTTPSLFQPIAPLVAFWKAGHVSVTRRNRRELELLARDYTAQFALTRIIFAYKRADGEVQPLSWHLTGKQKAGLHNQIVAAASCAQRAAELFGKFRTPEGRSAHGSKQDQGCAIESVNQREE